MIKLATFSATKVCICEGSKGAAQIMAQIAKPGKPVAVMNKLHDFHLVLEGSRPFRNRGRDYALNAAALVWTQLHRAVIVGDWFDRMFAERNKFLMDPNEPARDYAKPLVRSIGDKDKQTAWEPYLPVAHMAAGFRSALYKRNRGRYFSRPSMNRQEKLAELRDLLFDDISWVPVAIDAAEARLVLGRLHGLQATAKTRVFVFVSQKSQKYTPEAQN